MGTHRVVQPRPWLHDLATSPQITEVGLDHGHCGRHPRLEGSGRVRLRGSTQGFDSGVRNWLRARTRVVACSARVSGGRRRGLPAARTAADERVAADERAALRRIRPPLRAEEVDHVVRRQPRDHRRPEFDDPRFLAAFDVLVDGEAHLRAAEFSDGGVILRPCEEFEEVPHVRLHRTSIVRAADEGAELGHVAKLLVLEVHLP